MDYGVQFQKLCQVETRRLFLVIGITVAVVLAFQSFVLPYRNVISSLFPAKVPVLRERGFSTGDSPPKFVMVGNLGLLNDSISTESSMVHGEGNNTITSNLGNETELENETEVNDGGSEDVFESDGNENLENSFEPHDNRSSRNEFSHKNAVVLDKGSTLETAKSPDGSGSASLNKNSTVIRIPITNKLRKAPTSISEMNSLLLQNRISSGSMRPRWSSARDRELLSAKLQIENAPIIWNDPELYASLFRNVSTFKRSYELMTRILKVYIYKEGEKPIFHQPLLKGIYASEGWFMKMMEGNKQFVVKKPGKAHLFYLPFSTRMLRITLYGHSTDDLTKYLKDYVDMVTAKYRFWNRTDGADHFLVACHDWAPRETMLYMGKCIRALCNANVARDFKIGKDVSFPVTYVRTAVDPLKGLGGKPPSERPILAFFAGSMHGYLRPILLKHWEKDTDMKIFGPMPRSAWGKMNYAQHMKSSKYCICARGYEVHTPRVVEAIFYECVPVIISDNYVPPFFEVLNWEVFAVFIREKEVPNLKNILLSIPEDRYRVMQLNVKKVQKHFLWHKKPMKYDIFHMTLHSIWYNRVFQIKPR